MWAHVLYCASPLHCAISLQYKNPMSYKSANTITCNRPDIWPLGATSRNIRVACIKKIQFPLNTYVSEKKPHAQILPNPLLIIWCFGFTNNPVFRDHSDKNKRKQSFTETCTTFYITCCSPVMTSDDITIDLQLFSASLAYSATWTKFVCTATYKRTAQQHPNKPILKTATNHHAASRPTAAYFRSTMDWRYNTTKWKPKFADKTRQLSRDKKRGGGASDTFHKRPRPLIVQLPQTGTKIIR